MQGEKHEEEVHRPANEAIIDHAKSDAALLSEAFTRHDQDLSGSLDLAELVECLNFLGITPKTDLEKREIRNLIWGLEGLEVGPDEFAEQIVPNVRRKLAKLRESRHAALFNEADVRGMLEVTVEEVLHALRGRGTVVRDDVVSTAYGSFRAARLAAASREDEDCTSISTVSSGGLPFSWRAARLDEDDCASFVATLEEHIARDMRCEFERLTEHHSLGVEAEELWRHDLVELHRMFHEYDPCSGCYGSTTGVLDEAQVLRVLRESGYMLKGRQKQAAVASWVRKASCADGTLGFHGFLAIVRRLRELDRDRLRRLVDARLPKECGVVAISDFNDIRKDCGMAARGVAEREEIDALVEDYQTTGPGTLGREEVVVLCQRIGTKLRAMRHERERQHVLASGWTEQQFCEFRNAFQVFDDDMNELLERDEFVKAVEMLKGQYWQSPENMNLMFVAVGINPNKEVKVDFLTFLRLIKMLEDSEGRRQQGAAMGFGRERTDKLFSCFQALAPESHGVVKRDLLARALAGATARWMNKSQTDEIHRSLRLEPAQVQFAGFLRSLKVVEALHDGDIEAITDDMRAWTEAKLQRERAEARFRPSLLRLIRADN